MIDGLLNKFQDDPDIPAIIGLDNPDPSLNHPSLNHRPKFIDGPFWPMINVMNINAGRIKSYCYNKDYVELK